MPEQNSIIIIIMEVWGMGREEIPNRKSITKIQPLNIKVVPIFFQGNASKACVTSNAAPPYNSVSYGNVVENLIKAAILLMGL